jgi:hypothetical protein
MMTEHDLCACRDFTLAVYKSPAYEELSYALAVERLVAMGYASELPQVLRYDATFAARGLFLDKVRGTLIKADRYGFILRATLGKSLLSHQKTKEYYPAMQIPSDEIGSRYVPPSPPPPPPPPSSSRVSQKSMPTNNVQYSLLHCHHLPLAITC